MPIEVVPYRPEHESLVHALNERLEAGGSDWKFYNHALVKWLPAGLSDRVRREYFVALDHVPVVHGGFCLKTQVFSAQGGSIEAASMQGPVSEGLVDPRYAMLATRLVRDMERRQPRLFAWGASERIAGLLGRMGWTRCGAAGVMRVFHADRVLRSMPRLRSVARLRPALDLLAVTGAGAVGAAVAQFSIRLAAGGLNTRRLQSVEVDRFGPWADEIWAASAPNYRLIACRDAEAMNVILPVKGWPEATILRFDHGLSVVGWAAVRDTQFRNDRKFGDLRVGSIIDSLAVPGQEAAVIAAATSYLKRRGVDLAVSIYSHRTWLAAFRAAGYLVQPDQRPVYLAPAFAELAGATAGGVDQVHLTPLDGDGPHGF